MQKKTKYNSLLTVSADLTGHMQTHPLLLQKILLRHNQQLTEHSFEIDNFHQISPEFPKDENIYIIAHDLSEDFPKHSHSYFEMTYICHGELMNVIDGNEIYMSAGDLSLLNSKAEQSLKHMAKDTLLLNFCFRKEFLLRSLNSFYQNRNPISDYMRGENKNGRNYMLFSTANNAAIQAIISNIIQEYTQSGFKQSYGLEALFLMLFVDLIRTGEFSYYGLDQNALYILRYLKDNCLKKTLGEMANELSYNPDYLSSYIKKHTGRNCSSIIQETRLKNALRQLEETDYDIYHISENCGYTSPSHFFRIFKDNFGCTPGEYRKKIKW